MLGNVVFGDSRIRIWIQDHAISKDQLENKQGVALAREAMQWEMNRGVGVNSVVAHGRRKSACLHLQARGHSIDK